RDARVQYQSNRLIGLVWLAIGIVLTLCFFAALPVGTIQPIAVPGITAAVLGAGVFLTGALARIDWLHNLAVVWWLAALVMLLRPGVYTWLLSSALSIALYALPGVKLMQMARAR
ncbi:MAG: hypothetical protein RML32_08070, partial [Gammaproteobacteria bacterium]|nr:hypothetical protein [Gammaproteobacteria bacterium]